MNILVNIFFHLKLFYISKRIKYIYQKIGTFKIKKSTLAEEGYNMVKIKNDSIFYYDSKEQTYKQMNETIYQNIMDRKLILK